MPAKTYKACPVEGCPRRCRRVHAMCASHWSRVPKELQRQLYAALRRWRRDIGDAEAYRDYSETLDACIAEASS